MIETGMDYRNDGNGDNQTGCFRGNRQHDWDLAEEEEEEEEEEEGRIITSPHGRKGGSMQRRIYPGLLHMAFGVGLSVLRGGAARVFHGGIVGLGRIHSIFIRVGW